MDPIRVEKDDLVAKLRENRASHRKVFEEAVEGYRKDAVARLNEQIEGIMDGRVREVFIRIPRPEDHTRDYDRVIAMLEMSLDDEVVLSEIDFRSYVLDDWQWKREWLVSNQMYSKTADEMVKTLDG